MKVLIADDEKNIRDSIAAFIKAEGMEAVTAADGAEARALPGRARHSTALSWTCACRRWTGWSCWSGCRRRGRPSRSIVISAYGDVRDAVQAMKLGARDYLVKPFDPDELVMRLRRVLSEKARQARSKPAGGDGARRLDRRATRRCGRCARSWRRWLPTPSTVLITGESGTGKEIVARCCTRCPRTPTGPSWPSTSAACRRGCWRASCSGTRKAHSPERTERKRGMFELASSGTFFLDEIGDMPLHLQVKLLRVLQDRKVQRLGGTQAIPINARIVAATNRDLEAFLKEGKFREDLYYRLNVIRIEVPPLRERRADIPALAGYFVEKLNRQMGRKVRGLEPDALARLQAYSFPGNVRELENRIERAYILCTVGPHQLRATSGEPFSRPPAPLRDGKAARPGKGADRAGPRQTRRQSDPRRGGAGDQPADPPQQDSGGRYRRLSAARRSIVELWRRDAGLVGVERADAFGYLQPPSFHRDVDLQIPWKPQVDEPVWKRGLLLVQELPPIRQNSNNVHGRVRKLPPGRSRIVGAAGMRLHDVRRDRDCHAVLRGR